MGYLTATVLLLLWLACFLAGAACGWTLRGKADQGRMGERFPLRPGRKPGKPPSDEERRRMKELENIENFGTERRQQEIT